MFSLFILIVCVFLIGTDSGTTWFNVVCVFLSSLPCVVLCLASHTRQDICSSCDEPCCTNAFLTCNQPVAILARARSQGNGGALALLGVNANTRVATSTFVNCMSTLSGGAMWVSHYVVSYDGLLSLIESTKSSVAIQRCTFRGNAAATGGALAVVTESSVTIQSSQFKDNTASQEGGALTVATESSVTVQDSLFAHNAASDSGGAMLVTADASANIQASRFERNRALGLGGAALRVGTPRVALFANIFIDNVADSGGGGALLWDGSSSPSVFMACFYGWFPVMSGLTKDSMAYCASCPPGSYKDNITTAECSQCHVGKYSIAASRTCSACEPGKFQDAIGSSVCKTCALNTTSTAGSAFCFCKAGFYGDGGSCEACIANADSTDGSASCFCNAGFYGDGASCEACPAGSYKGHASVTRAASLTCTDEGRSHILYEQYPNAAAARAGRRYREHILY